MLLLYSRKLSREKKDLCSAWKLSPQNFGDVAHMEGVMCTQGALRSIDPFNMSLLKLFHINSLLPKPDGPLFDGYSIFEYHAANNRWNKLDKSWGGGGGTFKHGTYESFTPEKARIGKWIRRTVWHHLSYQSVTKGKYRVYVSNV